MGLEYLTYFCAGFAVIALVANVIFFVRQRDALKRVRNEGIEKLARRLGLETQDQVVTGTLDEVQIRATPSRVLVRQKGGSGKARIPSQQIDVGCDPEEEWIICRRSESDRLVDPPMPSLKLEITTGVQGLDEKYLIRARQEPAFAFWQEPLLRASLLDLDLVVATAGGGRVRAFYRPPQLANAFFEPERLERALVTTAAMTSERLVLLYHPQLVEPLPPPQSTGQLKWATIAGVAGGAITSYLWQEPEWETWEGPGQTWQGLAVGFTIVYVPVLVLVLVSKILRTRATGENNHDQDSTGAPYR